MIARVGKWRRFAPAFLKYGTLHLALYPVSWVIAFGMFTAAFLYAPDQLLWVLDNVIEPIAKSILDLFLKLAWSVVPEEVTSYIQTGKEVARGALQDGKQAVQGALREGKSLAKDVLGSWYPYIAGAAKEVGAEVGALAKDAGLAAKGLLDSAASEAVRRAKEVMTAQFRIVIHVVFYGFILVSVVAVVVRIFLSLLFLRNGFIDDILGRATDEDIIRARAKKGR